MAIKASAVGLTQPAREPTLERPRDAEPVAVYFFPDDPTDLRAVRRIFNDRQSVRLPTVPVLPSAATGSPGVAPGGIRWARPAMDAPCRPVAPTHSCRDR
jgi:hypothetical protein